MIISNTKSTFPDVTLSIVSHGQAKFVQNLLHDLSALPTHNFKVIVTINIPEDESSFPEVPYHLQIIRNNFPKGFGDNHNQAFSSSSTSYFCVLNPDLRIQSLNLEELLMPFMHSNVGAVAPLVLTPEGKIEDNARLFPTFSILAKRVFFRMRKQDYHLTSQPVTVDWVAGMFIVFKRDAYNQVNGFDGRRFFMYFEDVDICRRLAMKGWKVKVNPLVKVIHSAQRASHHNFKHVRWHLISAFRFLTGL